MGYVYVLNRLGIINNRISNVILLLTCHIHESGELVCLFILQKSHLKGSARH